MPKPTIELKSTPFTEVIELERIVTPDEEKKVDHIFVRRKKICTRHPGGFATEERDCKTWDCLARKNL